MIHRYAVSQLLAALTLLACLAAPARAGNGHFLHGVGAVNDALGGAGVALPVDALGALNLNPALLTELQGSQFEFSAEYAQAENTVASSAGPFSGKTNESGRRPLIPAFGFTRHPEDSTFAYGVGFLGLAGFGVDYPQDPNNPILAPQPHGFGRTFANYQFLKVPIVGAVRLSPELSLGAALVTGRSALTADPAGFAAPDCTPTGVCFVPRVATDSAFGIGGQLGVHYRPTSQLAFGLSWTSETHFQSFEWNSAVANPALPTFGTARRISFKLNNPQTVVGGIGFTPMPELKIALDGKWLNYASTTGFGGTGVDPATGQARGLGWKNITVIDAGAQYQATSRLVLRAGYNHAQNAIPNSASFFNVESPAIWSNHVTGGIGLQVEHGFELNFTYYRALRTSITGPFVSPVGPVPGTSVTNSMSLSSLLGTFSFRL